MDLWRNESWDKTLNNLVDINQSIIEAGLNTGLITQL